MKLTQETDCREIPELNAANFMNDLKIVKNIKAIQNVTIEDILDNDDLFVVPKPNVCINLGTGERVVCVKVKQNEALSEPTKVQTFQLTIFQLVFKKSYQFFLLSHRIVRIFLQS